MILNDSTRQTNLHNIIINTHFQTLEELYYAYMPFIKGGGLFITSREILNIGELLDLNIKLFNSPTYDQITGKIIWLKFASYDPKHPTGFGVQLLSNKGQVLKEKIEHYLKDMLQSSNTTHTM